MYTWTRESRLRGLRKVPESTVAMPTSTPATASSALATEIPRTRPSLWARLRRNRLAVAGVVVLAVFYTIALLAPVITPYPYDQLTSGMRNKPPSMDHWMGTDRQGRDVLSRLIKGGQVSLAA